MLRAKASHTVKLLKPFRLLVIAISKKKVNFSNKWSQMSWWLYFIYKNHRVDFFQSKIGFIESQCDWKTRFTDFIPSFRKNGGYYRYFNKFLKKGRGFSIRMYFLYLLHQSSFICEWFDRNLVLFHTLSFFVLSHRNL